MKGDMVVKSIKMVLAGLLLSGVVGGSQIFGATAPNTTQTNSGGGVTVKATLLDAKSSGDLRFQITLDTHSVNLDSYDLKAITVLRDGAANIYQPTSIENKGSGHHRQTTVIFPKPKNGVKRIELVIKDIAGVKERVFRWDLE